MDKSYKGSKWKIVISNKNTVLFKNITMDIKGLNKMCKIRLPNKILNVTDLKTITTSKIN